MYIHTATWASTHEQTNELQGKRLQRPHTKYNMQWYKTNQVCAKHLTKRPRRTRCRDSGPRASRAARHATSLGAILYRTLASYPASTRLRGAAAVSPSTSPPTARGGRRASRTEALGRGGADTRGAGDAAARVRVCARSLMDLGSRARRRGCW